MRLNHEIARGPALFLPRVGAVFGLCALFIAGCDKKPRQPLAIDWAPELVRRAICKAGDARELQSLGLEVIGGQKFYRARYDLHGASKAVIFSEDGEVIDHDVHAQSN